MISSRHSMGREIRDALVHRILEGKYQPGERLVELQLAAEFHTSQAPVREALRQLEALQYVETTPHRGTRVREVPATEMRDAYRLRALLEREAAETAARALHADWEQMRAAVLGIERAADAGNVRGYARHDEAFHRALVARSENPVLLRHWDLLLVPTRILVALRAGVIDMGKTAKEHRPILEALERHDAVVAGQLAYDHVNRIAARLDPAARPH
jgi:DNA-binding GntR family transcriptional regulator